MTDEHREAAFDRALGGEDSPPELASTVLLARALGEAAGEVDGRLAPMRRAELRRRTLLGLASARRRRRSVKRALTAAAAAVLLFGLYASQATAGNPVYPLKLAVERIVGTAPVLPLHGTAPTPAPPSGSAPVAVAAGGHTAGRTVVPLAGLPPRTTVRPTPTTAPPRTTTAPIPPPVSLVGAPPEIVTQPADVTVCAGETATFTAKASGSPAPAVQWRVAAAAGSALSPLHGATNEVLSFPATASQNGSVYAAAFSNVRGAAQTSPATLTVQTAPTVTTEPSDQIVNAGQTAVFTTAAAGTPSPAIQWQVEPAGSSSFAPIDGATSPELSVTAAATDSGNQYQALLSNECGSVTTNAVTLTVSSQPPSFTSPSSASFTSGQANTFSVVVGGTPTPAITESGTLPLGVTFVDNGNGTGTLAGTPATGSEGQYAVTFTADNGVGSAAQQSFTLNVVAPPGGGTRIAGSSRSAAAPANPATGSRRALLGTAGLPGGSPRLDPALR